MQPTSIQRFRNQIGEGLQSQNPPEGSKVEGPALDEEASPAANGAGRSSRLKKFSLKLEGGIGWKNFGNGAGMDHFGWTARLAAGFFLPLGNRVRFGSRAFIELQQFNKSIVAGIQSSALMTAGGVETEIAITAHRRWFSVHPGMGFGVVHYRSKSDDFGFQGAQYGGFTLLNPMNDVGFRAEIGLGLCTMGGALCVTPRFQADLGINPEVVRPPIAGPEFGLNVFGFNLGASIDLLQLIADVGANRRHRTEVRREKSRNTHTSEASTPEHESAGPGSENSIAPYGSSPTFNDDASSSEGISEPPSGDTVPGDRPSPIFDPEFVFRDQPLNYDEVHELKGLIQAVEQLEPDQLLLVVFSADWCPACKELKGSFDSIAADLKKENGDKLKIVWAEGRNGSEQDWVNLGVTAFPTFALIDGNGQMRILEK